MLHYKIPFPNPIFDMQPNPPNPVLRKEEKEVNKQNF
jgi:hypothetical protein